MSDFKRDLSGHRCAVLVCVGAKMKVKPLIKDSDTEDSRSKIMTELSIRNLSAIGRQYYISGEECISL